MRTTLPFFVILCSLTGRAEMGITDSAGKYVADIGNQAALSNRKVADRLFQNAIQHEQQGWATLNVSMLVQALQESLDGVKANNQSRELGRSALGAVKTGTTGGHLDVKDYGKMSVEELKRFSDSSSKHLPMVKGKLDSWGFKVSYDNQTVESKFGKFSINQLNEDILEKVILAKARSLGLGTLVSEQKVKKGIAQALAERNRIAREVFSDMKLQNFKAKTNSEPKTRLVQQPSPSKEKDVKPEELSTETSQERRFRELFPDFKVADMPEPDTRDVREQSMEVELKYDQYKELTEKRLGLKDKQRIGASKQNIFRMVHIRYQALRRKEKFIEPQQRSRPYKIATTQAP